MKTIKLTQGYETIIDEKYFLILSQHKWYATKYKKNNIHYAERNLPRKNGKQSKVKMHRLIMELEGHNIKDNQVDHKDNNGLNNQIDNLRVCSHTENSRNSQKRKNNTSGYKGITRKNKKWQAKIKINGITKHLGYFFSKKDAAKAYDVAAIQYFGEFAHINFPKENYIINAS